MAFQPSKQMIEAARRESAAFELFCAKLTEFKAYVGMRDMEHAAAARKEMHDRLDAYADAYSATLAVGHRDQERGV